MNSPSDELVDVVDGHDKVVGAATLRQCLTAGLLHRAVAVIIERKGGRVLLQRRSLKDMWHAGLWTLSSTGHVRKGEAYSAAARRELREELGICPRLVAHSKMLLPPIRSRGMTEWEWVSLFTSNTDAVVTIDPVELDSVREFAIPELEKMLTPGRLTPDAKIVIRSYLQGFSGRPTGRARTNR